MHVVSPHKPQANNSRQKNKFYILALLILVSVLYILVVLFSKKDVVNPPPLTTLSLAKPQSVSLQWPSYGESAIGGVGYGVLATGGSQNQVPIASLAKVITAMAVLKQYPLALNEQGPNITVTNNDVTDYKNFVLLGGSVVPVTVGEQLNEYQALQALLVPSANNIADFLVNWAFGSENNYIIFANQLVHSLGLTQTHIADASGFSPLTTSTAKDLTLLAVRALDNPVIAQITDQLQINFPGVGTVNNINTLIGQDNIIGVKTGNTDQAGGCFIFAAKHLVGNTQVIVVGTILGAPNLAKAFQDAIPLLNSANEGFSQVTLVHKNQLITSYQARWGETESVISSSNLQGIIWKAKPPLATISLLLLVPPQRVQDTVGNLHIAFGRAETNTPLILNSAFQRPPLKWQLLHNL